MSLAVLPSADEILSGTPPFDLADPRERALLGASSEIRLLGVHRSLFSRGAPARCIHIVASGMIRVGVLSPDGVEMVFHFVGPGGVIGILDSLVHRETSVDAVAAQKSVVLSVKVDAVRRFISGNAEAAMSLLSVVGAFAAETQRHYEDVAFLDLRTRAAKRLVAFLGTSEPGNVIRVSQRDFASAICATRERLNKVLGEWQTQGVVECLRGRIIVHEPDALRALAGQRPPETDRASC